MRAGDNGRMTRESKRLHGREIRHTVMFIRYGGTGGTGPGARPLRDGLGPTGGSGARVMAAAGWRPEMPGSTEMTA